MTGAPDPLAEVALAFWQMQGVEARYSSIFSGCLMVKRDGETGSWRYSDLGAVMESVRVWHRKQGLFLSMFSYPEIEGYSVTVFDARFTVDCEHQNPCQALMAACVAAARKLNTQS